MKCGVVVSSPHLLTMRSGVRFLPMEMKEHFMSRCKNLQMESSTHRNGLVNDVERGYTWETEKKEVVEVLHMNGGTGDTSYANNSMLQRKVILLAKPITDEAITDLYSRLLPKTICIADMGCSSGPNTFIAVSELIKAVDKKRRILGHESPEFHIHLNDLPCNDFNTIFRSLPSFQKNIREQMGSGFGSCYFSGVSGSFYGRLFPSHSLHFVYSSYSLMWLSQVPAGAEANKGNIYLSTTSPETVIRLYLNQFQKDFTSFLRCRAAELVANGSMVLTVLGRKSDDPCSKECCYIYGLLAKALNEMVSKGLIKEDKMDTFNIPLYTSSPPEVKAIVEEEGSFTITRLVASEVPWDALDMAVSPTDAPSEGGGNVARTIRAVTEPLLVGHFGEAIIEDVFSNYKKLLIDCMSTEKASFVNVTVSLKKRG